MRTTSQKPREKIRDGIKLRDKKRTKKLTAKYIGVIECEAINKEKNEKERVIQEDKIQEKKVLFQEDTKYCKKKQYLRWIIIWENKVLFYQDKI